MKHLSCYILVLGMLALALGLSGCGTGSAGLRAASERLFDEGHANRMIRYGDELYKRGKIREAYAAFLQAENLAYTSALRNQSRARRMYVQQQIQALEYGVTEPPPLPDMNNGFRPASATLATTGTAITLAAPPPWVQPGKGKRSAPSGSGQPLVESGGDASQAPESTAGNSGEN